MLLRRRVTFVFAVAALSGCATGTGGPEYMPIQPAGERVACVQDEDSDEDDISDACEIAFAQAFAPDFVAAKSACNWDDSVENGRLGGGYFFAVQRVDSSTTRIAYLPAFYQ